MNFLQVQLFNLTDMVIVNSNDKDDYRDSIRSESGYYPFVNLAPEEEEYEKGSKWQKFKDGFKKYEIDEPDPSLPQAERAIILTSTAPLQRRLKGRHLQMIAIGGSIGTGLFIGSGKALEKGGPAAIIIAWVLVGSAMFCVIHALGELTVAFPVSGAYSAFSVRFLDPSWGFAMGWNYSIGWLVTLPLELVAASITIEFWNTTVDPAIFVLIFYLLILVINLFGVRGYGEAEFIFSLIKVVAVIFFIILGIVLICGGGPKGGFIGGKYWSNPGAFSHGFKGVCSVFVTAAMSFGGTEIVGLASAETENPRKTLPRATKQVFWRITLFYFISLVIVGLLVPYNDERLGSGSSDYDASASPFVIAIRNAGISGLPSVMNAIIMISVLSVGNSAVFACSRTIAALAMLGQAPKFLAYIDRKGRPLAAVGLNLLFGLVAFSASSDARAEIFTWLMAISGLSFLVTWASICAAHIRFRYVLRSRGRDTNELAFKSVAGVYGSLYAVIMFALILCMQFWVSLVPVGSSKPSAKSFFEGYLALPVILFLYIGHKIWTKNWKFYLDSSDIDIDLGRRELDLDLLREEVLEEKEYIASKNFFYRAYRFWC